MTWKPQDEPVLIANATPRRLGRGSRVVLAIAAAFGCGAAWLAAGSLVDGSVSAGAGAAATTARVTTASPTTDRGPADAVIPGPVLQLGTHPLLSPGLAPPAVDCALPELGRTVESFAAHHAAFVGCLDAVWRPMLAARGLPHRPPKLNHAADPGLTGCGRDEPGDEVVGWYCDLDDMIHLPIDRLLRDVHPYGEAAHLALVAHEYGHHVQGESGLLLAFEDEVWRLGADGAAVAVAGRRLELQADCFGTLAVRAVAGRGGVSDRLARAVLEGYDHQLDSDTHGSGRSQLSWARRGFDSGATEACNTWLAPETDVR